MAKGKWALVLMESLSESRHSFPFLREKVTGPVDLYRYDPLVQAWCMYKEKKRLKAPKRLPTSKSSGQEE